MIRKYYNLLLLPVVAMLVCSCRTTTTTLDSFYNSEIECLGVGYDGSQTLRVWGVGGSEANAVEDAHKKAVYTVLFKGITGGAQCSSKPIVTEVNAFERHQEYFNRFFSRRGGYRRFVSRNNEKYGSRMIEYNASRTKYGLTVTVLNPQLKAQLIKDGIIKQ